MPICSNVQPDVTYDDVGGAGEALEKLREVVELPLLHPERFVTLGIDPPKVRSPPPPLHTRILTHACAHTPCSLSSTPLCPLKSNGVLWNSAQGMGLWVHGRVSCVVVPLPREG